MADRLRLVQYDVGSFEAQEDVDLEGAIEAMKQPNVGWLLVDGPSEDDYQRLEVGLGLHPLALEDCRNTRQRPKVEEYDTNTYIVMRSVRIDVEGRIVTEQVNLFLGGEWVLVVGERPPDLFAPVLDRLRRGRARIRGSGADYLAYALIDAVVDTVGPVVADTARRFERLEDDIFDAAGPEHLGSIQGLKHDLRRLHRQVALMRDAVARMLREEATGFGEATRPFLRDVLDHTGQALDQIETLSDAAGHLTDLYLTMVSNKTNDIMKVLTLVATVFIPLSFLAGVYGMNFDTAEPGNMPELGWPYAYLAFWGIVLVVLITSVVLFRRRGWI